MPADINTHTRLFDLVRYMRSKLLEEELITEAEYFWLCCDAPMAKGPGSPSPRRLEDYDDLRNRIKRMEKALKSIAAHYGPGCQDGFLEKIAAEALIEPESGLAPPRKPQAT